MTGNGEHRRPKVQGTMDQTAVLPAVFDDGQREPGTDPEPTGALAVGGVVDPARAPRIFDPVAPGAPIPTPQQAALLPPRVTEVRVNEADARPSPPREWTGVATGLLHAEQVHELQGRETAGPAPDLEAWWVSIARGDAHAAAIKAAAYGSNSLMEEGRKVAKLQGREVTDDEALELGCWNYITGKSGRWSDAVLRGERVGDDTLLDIVTYAMMARRIRAAGNWPG